MAALVEVSGLSKRYDPSPWWMRVLTRRVIAEPVHALRDVSLTVEPSQICCVLGPNGSGKSTLFRILMGLTSPTGGEVTVLGQAPDSRDRSVLRQIGYMPADDRTLFLRLTCAENLRLHAAIQGVPRAESNARVAEALASVGLRHVADRGAFVLSSGMRARLLLARALVHRPELLILDEPTAAIDPVGAFELLDLIQKITEERSLSVLLSSHRLDEIEALHDQLLVLREGAVAYHGPLRAVRRLAGTTRMVLGFSSSERADQAERRCAELDLATTRAHGISHVEISLRDPIRVMELLGRLGPAADLVDHIETREPSLREFLASLNDAASKDSLTA